MTRSPNAPGRRPSRIYAGIELSQPVNIGVPIALSIVAIAVWRLRSQFMEPYESIGPHRSYIGRLTVETGALDKSEVETSIVWLAAGAAACLLALAWRWWRGRREWGDVPLAYGLGVCGFVYLILSSARFGELGGISLLSGGLGVPVAVAFMLVAGFLGYMTLELAVRRRRGDRRPLLALLVVFVVVPFLALRIGRSFERATLVRLDDGSLLEVDLPRIKYSIDRPRGPLGADLGTPVYYGRGSDLWLARMDGDGDAAMLVCPILLGAEGSLTLEQQESIASMRARLEDYPVPISVAIGREFAPAELSRIARDARTRFPAARQLSVIGTTAGEKPRGTIALTEAPLWPLDDSVLMRVDVAPREPHIVLDRLDPEALWSAIENRRVETPRAGLQADRELDLQVRLRVPEATSIEDLGAFYANALAFNGVSMFLE
ncbi:MAG: hypothetical protein H6831_06040 [Planctomycetes bacterium]|nr:hypothetical protein [Planctomycetota bacterium]MCB9903952.1 hypothetical protein [Planctomycetota bacterium]